MDMHAQVSSLLNIFELNNNGEIEIMLINNLQDSYLDNLCNNNLSVSIYLINGIKLSGVISSFDQEVILLKDNKSTMDQLLYKHAISTIVPNKPAPNNHVQAELISE